MALVRSFESLSADAAWLVDQGLPRRVASWAAAGMNRARLAIYRDRVGSGSETYIGAYPIGRVPHTRSRIREAFAQAFPDVDFDHIRARYPDGISPAFTDIAEFFEYLYSPALAPIEHRPIAYEYPSLAWPDTSGAGADAFCPHCGRSNPIYTDATRRYCTGCTNVCAACGARTRNGYLCSACRDNPIHRCSTCGRMLAHGGICSDCLERRRTCPDCGETHYERGRYCRACLVNYRYCPECGEYYPRTQDACRCAAEIRLRNHSYKPKWVVRGDVPHIGCELEIETGGRQCRMIELLQEHTDATKLILKTDGSLEDGMELVTHPADLPTFRTLLDWPHVLSKLAALGARSHDTTTCGLHFHLTKPARDGHRVRLAYFVARHQRNLAKLARRTSSRWARYEDFDGDGVDYYERAINDDDRYKALNWQNDETVEFRACKGTLSASTLLASAELVDAMWRYTGDKGMDHLAKSHAWANFCQDTYSSKSYTNLHAYMSARGVLTGVNL